MIFFLACIHVVLRLSMVSLLLVKHEFQTRYVIMTNYIPRFNFVHKQQCKNFGGEQKTYKEVWY